MPSSARRARDNTMAIMGVPSIDPLVLTWKVAAVFSVSFLGFTLILKIFELLGQQSEERSSLQGERGARQRVRRRLRRARDSEYEDDYDAPTLSAAESPSPVVRPHQPGVRKVSGSDCWHDTCPQQDYHTAPTRCDRQSSAQPKRLSASNQQSFSNLAYGDICPSWMQREDDRTAPTRCDRHQSSTQPHRSHRHSDGSPQFLAKHQADHTDYEMLDELSIEPLDLGFPSTELKFAKKSRVLSANEAYKNKIRGEQRAKISSGTRFLARNMSSNELATPPRSSDAKHIQPKSKDKRIDPREPRSEKMYGTRHTSKRDHIARTDSASSMPQRSTEPSWSSYSKTHFPNKYANHIEKPEIGSEPSIRRGVAGAART